MALPFDIRDLMKSGSQFMKEREQPVRLAVLVELDAPEPLLEAVETGLHPRTATGSLSIDVVEPAKPIVVDPVSDAAVVVVGSGGAAVVSAVKAARDAGVPVFAVALVPEERRDELARLIGMPAEDVVADTDAARTLVGLAKRVTDHVTGKRLALAHNFTVMRRAVAEESVKATAWQNGLIGVVAIIPGADLPLMTANQAKMLMQIAAAYGQPLGVDRIKELAAVVGGGFLLRAFARQALTVIPGFGWVVKGGVAWTGTVAMGKAAIRYFEEGADLGKVLEDLGQMRGEYAGRLGRRVGELRSRRAAGTGIPAEPAAPALPHEVSVAWPEPTPPAPVPAAPVPAEPRPATPSPVTPDIPGPEGPRG